MIGRNMENMLFGDGPNAKRFEFYKWERDVKQILDEVRERGLSSPSSLTLL